MLRAGGRGPLRTAAPTGQLACVVRQVVVELLVRGLGKRQGSGRRFKQSFQATMLVRWRVAMAQFGGIGFVSGVAFFEG